MVGMIITWSIPMRSISLSLARGSYAPGCSTYFFCSGVSPICCSLRDLLRHLRPGEADRVVAREVVGGAADHRRPPIQHCLVLVLPVRAAHELPVLGLDVPTPDLVGVVDVGVAVEDGERLGDALLPVRAAHGVPPQAGCAGRRTPLLSARGREGSRP